MDKFDGIFDRLRTERLTESGRAFIDMAEIIAGGVRTPEVLAEARQWARLGLTADDKSLERTVKHLQDLLLKKGGARAKAKALEAAAAAVGGNVVPMPSRPASGDAL